MFNLTKINIPNNLNFKLKYDSLMKNIKKYKFSYYNFNNYINSKDIIIFSNIFKDTSRLILFNIIYDSNQLFQMYIFRGNIIYLNNSQRVNIKPIILKKYNCYVLFIRQLNLKLQFKIDSQIKLSLNGVVYNNILIQCRYFIK